MSAMASGLPMRASRAGATSVGCPAAALTRPLSSRRAPLGVSTCGGGRSSARARSATEPAPPVVEVEVAVDPVVVSPTQSMQQDSLSSVVVVEAESSLDLSAVPGDGEEDAAPAPPAAPSSSAPVVDVVEAAVQAALAAQEPTPTSTSTPTPTPTPTPTSTSAAAQPAAAPASPGPSGRPRRGPAPRVELPLDLLNRHAGPGAPDRSQPPALDLARVANALLAEDPSIGPVFSSLFELSRTAAAASPSGAPGPILYVPGVPRPPGSPPSASLPLLVYLPGIDGTGLAAYRQFPSLAARFDFRAVFLPPQDRSPFGDLVDSLAQQIEDEVADCDPSRPVYLLGESFGGLLALALAQRLSCVDRLVLVNPATSFDSSPWPALGPLLPQLPPDVYKLLPVALAPVLSNPLAMVRRMAAPNAPPAAQLADLMHGLLDLLPELSSLRVVLPPETLAWRLQLLKEGAAAVNPTLKNVRQRTLLLAGQLDFVIPSAGEAERLPKAMPRCRSRVLQGRSHALLQESGVDVVRLMQEEDFYVARRNLTRSNAPTAADRRRHRSASGGANFGTAGPLELPTPGELRRALDEYGLAGLKRLVSPVFLSTDAASGRVQLGLGGLPPPPGRVPGQPPRPVLFVGNHQLFAPDMPLMIEHFLAERGQLLRGLAHPMALGVGPQGVFGEDGAGDNQSFGRFLETFGAVQVSGRNLHTLLAAGEAALLYPGGVREALKLRGERYQLIWPRRQEFVRMAAKLGATIVPFAAIGAEDSVQVLADREELMNTPVLGPWLRQQDKQVVKARRGVNETADVSESFTPPLIAPGSPSRFYFLFGAPIETSPDMAEDRAVCEELYGRVKGEVEGGLGYLLRKRDQDPYKDLLPRLLYEASWGGRRQAPTFQP